MMKSFKKKSVDIDELESGILLGDRVVLAQAITLIESLHVADQEKAEELIQKILPKTGRSIRIGITGVPGVGKSTFIEAFGQHLTSLGKKIAVLAVDPSSQKTKGSILGDKTRMDELSKNPLAFIRPSATRGSLGGVTNATRDAILLCEAAGFEIIIVETVGVGQSETAVHEMTDFFLLLMLGGAGDELQGIKKGIMEMADGIVITKADGENVKSAYKAQADYQHALHLFGTSKSGWTPKVLTASALKKEGINEIWSMIQKFASDGKANGFFDNHRIEQDVIALHKNLEGSLKMYFTNKSKELLLSFENKIKAKQLSPRQAARIMLENILEMKK